MPTDVTPRAAAAFSTPSAVIAGELAVGRGRARTRATNSELIVVRDRMVAPLLSRSQSIDESGLPRRTYQTTLRRAYLRGWIVDRYLPAPALTRLPFAVFAIAESDADGPRPLLDEVRRRARLVHCWAGPRQVFTVAFAPTGSAAADLIERMRRVAGVRSVWAVAANALEDGLPIYFDFEGEWAHYGGLTGSSGYPQALGAADDSPPARSPTTRESELAETLVLRPFLPGSDGSGTGIARWSSAFAERRMFHRGWLTARTFLDPGAIAASFSDFAGGLTYVAGALRPGVPVGTVREELLGLAGVRPFLLATNERDLLLGFLASGPRTRLATMPVQRSTVRRILEARLERIRFWNEPFETLETPVNHRYDHLFE